MTGAELRAWRERLGKDEAWIHEILDAVDVASGSHNGNGSTRRLMVELGHHEGSYDVHEREALRTAYRAALEAEEARQVAERGPVEPVCPEGVTVERACGRGPMLVFGHRDYSGGNPSRIVVDDDGTIRYGAEASKQHGLSAAQCRHAADLSEYRAAIHAASDRQRKLDAVKAAEAAERDAETAKEIAWQAYDATLAPLGAARDALRTARREAGL